MNSPRIHRYIAIVSAVTWLPWATYVIALTTFSPKAVWLDSLFPVLLGLGAGVVAWRARAGWQSWVFAMTQVQMLLLAYGLGSVLERPIHQDSNCAICSLVDTRLNIVRHYLSKDQVGTAAAIAWPDLILPIGIVIVFALSLWALIRNQRGGPAKGP